MKRSFEGEQVLTRTRLECSLVASMLIGSCQPHGVVEKLGGSPTRSDVVRECGSGLGRDHPQCRSHTSASAVCCLLLPLLQPRGQLTLGACLQRLSIVFTLHLTISSLLHTIIVPCRTTQSLSKGIFHTCALFTKSRTWASCSCGT